MTNPILERLSEDNPEALVADGFDSAVIGVGYQGPQGPVAVYSYSKCIEALEAEGMDYEEALEYFEFNVQSAWVGENGPIFLYEEPKDI